MDLLKPAGRPGIKQRVAEAWEKRPVTQIVSWVGSAFIVPPIVFYFIKPDKIFTGFHPQYIILLVLALIFGFGIRMAVQKKHSLAIKLCTLLFIGTLIMGFLEATKIIR